MRVRYDARADGSSGPAELRPTATPSHSISCKRWGIKGQPWNMQFARSQSRCWLAKFLTLVPCAGRDRHPHYPVKYGIRSSTVSLDARFTWRALTRGFKIHQHRQAKSN